MGCDIHPYFEAKNDDGAWERITTRHDELRNYLYGRDEEEEADTPSPTQRTKVLKPKRKFKNQTEDTPVPVEEPTEVDESLPLDKRKPVEDLTTEERSGLMEEMRAQPTDLGRNYSLFAILAGVRNYEGGFKPISEARGLISDLSPQGLRANCCGRTDETVAEWTATAMKWVTQGYSVLIQKDPLLVSSPDYHSHSWYLLQELLDYDWDEKTSLQSGVVEQSVYAEWKKSGSLSPSMKCRSVFGNAIQHVTEEEMIHRIKDGLPADEKVTREVEGEQVETTQLFYCQVEYEMSYHACCQHFVEETLPFLKQYADEHLGGDYRRLRFVFWFDN